MQTLTQENLVKVTAILEQLDQQPLPVKRTDRRVARRVPLRTPLHVKLLSATTDRSARMDIFCRNISSSGMGFMSRRMFREDERVVISLILKQLVPRLVLARIVFSRYVRGGLYEMGAEFLACIPDPDHAGQVPLSWLTTQIPSTGALSGGSRNNPPPQVMAHFHAAWGAPEGRGT